MIELNGEEREELTRWSRSRTLPAGDVFKARVVLALADGLSYSQIEAELKTSRPTIARWKARFEKERIAGLEGRHLGSKPRTVTPAIQARVLKKTQEKPEDGSTHWSCRKNGCGHRTQFHNSTSHLVKDETQTAPSRPLHGQQ